MIRGDPLGHGCLECADNWFTAHIAGIAFPRTHEVDPFHCQDHFLPTCADVQAGSWLFSSAAQLFGRLALRAILCPYYTAALLRYSRVGRFWLDDKYERHYNICNSVNQYRPDTPLNPIISVDLKNFFNPINRVNPNNPFNPINEVNPKNPLNPINCSNPDTPFAPLNRPYGSDG